jgi:hypothetical protein
LTVRQQEKVKAQTLTFANVAKESHFGQLQPS